MPRPEFFMCASRESTHTRHAPRPMRYPIPRILVSLALVALAFAAGRWSMRVETGFSGRAQPKPHVDITLAPRSTPQSGNPAKPVVVSTGFDELMAELDPRKRREGLAGLARLEAAKNPQHAWKLLEGITGLADRQVYAEAVIGEWAKQAPKDAIKAAGGLPAGELQASCMAASSSVWARSAPVEAMDFAFTQLTGSGRQMAIAAASSEWARTDVNAAARWALANSQSMAGVQAIGQVMELWGDTDPKSGADWASTLPEGSFKTRALESVVLQWADQTPSEVAAWLKNRPADDTLNQLVAGAWAKSDPESAATWSLTLPAGDVRSAAMSEIVAAWAAASPSQALAWAANQPGPAASALTAQAVRTWSAEDPETAYAWALQSADSATLSRAVLETWSANNSDGFLKWADTIPPATRSDSVRDLMATALGDTAPARAIVHADAIRDPSLRMESIERVLGTWIQSDPAAAKAWKAAHLPAKKR